MNRELKATFAFLGIVLVASLLPAIAMVASQSLAGRSLDKLTQEWLIDHLNWSIMCQMESLAVTLLLSAWIFVIPSWSIKAKGAAIGAVLIGHTFVGWACLYIRGLGGL